MGVDPIAEQIVHSNRGKHQARLFLTVTTVLVGNEQQLSLVISHKNSAAAVHCQHIHRHPVAGVELILPVSAVSKLKIGQRAPHGPVRCILQLLLLFFHGKAVYLINKRAAQHGKSQHDHQGIDQKIACKQTLHALRLRTLVYSFSAIAPSCSSNL